MNLQDTECLNFQSRPRFKNPQSPSPPDRVTPSDIFCTLCPFHGCFESLQWLFWSAQMFDWLQHGPSLFLKMNLDCTASKLAGVLIVLRLGPVAGYCLEKCPFVRHRFGHRCQRKVLLFCNFMGLRKCELLININKIQVNHTIIVVLRAGDPSTRPSFTVINFLCFRALLGQSGLISKLFRNRSHLRKSKFVI